MTYCAKKGSSPPQVSMRATRHLLQYYIATIIYGKKNLASLAVIGSDKTESCFIMVSFAPYWICAIKDSLEILQSAADRDNLVA